MIADLDLDPERLCACLHNSDRLRVTIMGNEESVPVWDNCVTKGHRFRGRGGLVQERCVRDIEFGQIDDHLLEIEQRFEPALRDLRLVRRVSSIPAGIFENVSLDHGRRNAVVIAGADKRAGDFVSFCDHPKLCQRLHLRLGFRQIQWPI